MEIEREIARNLVESFRPYVDSEIDGDDGFEFCREQQSENARQCALVCTNKILTNIEATLLYTKNPTAIEINKKCWLTVKEILENRNF